MKKSVINIIAFVFLGIVFISCSKEDTKETPPPSLILKSGLQTGTGFIYVGHDTTLKVGTKFVIGITAKSESGENLKRLYIQRKFESGEATAMLDFALNNVSISFDTVTYAHPSVGFEDFTCTVWDNKDMKTEIIFTITTEPAPPDIITYSDIILGAQASPTGSSFASADGTIYTLDQAKINSDKIDFLYFYGDPPNKATLAAPNDVDAATAFPGPNGLSFWTVKNPTKFKTTTLSSANFDAIQSNGQLVPVATLPTNPNLSKANDLAVGDVLAFMTANSHFGLIRIDAINGANNAGTIKITVKVQPQ